MKSLIARNELETSRAAHGSAAVAAFAVPCELQSQQSELEVAAESENNRVISVLLVNSALVVFAMSCLQRDGFCVKEMS